MRTGHRFTVFLLDESGPTAVEYALMLALILIAASAAVAAIGNQAGGLWANDVNKIGAATGP